MTQPTLRTCYQPSKTFPAPLVSVRMSDTENVLAWLVEVSPLGATVQWLAPHKPGYQRSRYYKRQDLEPVHSTPRLSEVMQEQ